MLEYLELLKLIFISNERYIYIIKGLLFSVGTTACSTIIGVILGILVALLQLSEFYPFKNSKKFKDFNPLSKLAFWYVNILRGTPVVVQLMIWANVIFVDSLRDTPILIIAAIAFGINSGAYVSEIIRAGINSIDKGQIEAGSSLGLNYPQIMRYIIMPQAIKNILPALGNEFITLVKETSVGAYIGIIELTKASDIVASRTYEYFFPLIIAAIIYLIITLSLSKLISIMERKLNNANS